MKVVITAGSMGARMSDETHTLFLLSGKLSRQPSFPGSDFGISDILDVTIRTVRDTFQPDTFHSLGRSKSDVVAKSIGSLFRHGL